VTRKQVPEAPSVEDIGAALGARYITTPPAPAPRRQPSGRAAMTRRSWLLPTEVAEALTAAADRIHHGSGGKISKSAAQAALISAGLRHENEVTQALSATGDTGATDPA
jgi:hypothetical protein